MFILLTICLLFQIKSKVISEVINPKSPSKIKGVIFDLDGTLINTQGLYDEANQMLINKYGNGKIYSPEYQMNTHGSSPAFGNKFIIEQFQINITLEKFLELKDNYINERVTSCKAMEGAEELTNNLKHKYGLKIAIATSSYKDSVDKKLSIHKKWIDSDFDLIITGEDKRIKSGKPSPDIFILAANSLGLKPEECIIFEDSMNGIKAAISSGAGIVVGLPANINTQYTMEIYQYDKYKTKFIILNSLKDFDYSVLELS
jgi:pseudouridine-5'-monophosphatase